MPIAGAWRGGAESRRKSECRGEVECGVVSRRAQRLQPTYRMGEYCIAMAFADTLSEVCWSFFKRAKDFFISGNLAPRVHLASERRMGSFKENALFRGVRQLSRFNACVGNNGGPYRYYGANARAIIPDRTTFMIMRSGTSRLEALTARGAETRHHHRHHYLPGLPKLPPRYRAVHQVLNFRLS
jgi:hypothetical protein